MSFLIRWLFKILLLHGDTMSRDQTYILAGGILLALCALAVLTVAIFFIGSGFEGWLRPPAEVVSTVPDPRPGANGNSMGDPDSPIRIEEFSDFQCPYCRSFHNDTEPLLVDQYISTGKVYFTYRSMGNFISDNIARGSDSPSTESRNAALAAYCAGDQNKFWEMQAHLFANVLGEEVGSFTDKRINLIAKTAALDMDDFSSCYDSGRYEDRIRQDFEDAQAAGIVGVPSFVLTYTVNGETKTRLIEGAQLFSVFQQELEAVLHEMGAR